MAFTQAQIAEAVGVQHEAAHDLTQQVRLIAGPGSGKSQTIQERVRFLLASGFPAASIYAVSFTRASAADLRLRIDEAENAAAVNVSTLHSLALKLLRLGGQLQGYPVDPLILDRWEMANIYDSEFGKQVGLNATRCRAVRELYEAYVSTGTWAPPTYAPPAVPVTEAERTGFEAFHSTRRSLYSCVLPGEMVRQCLSAILAGNMDPIALLNAQHLIVDEYQDLNPVDVQFIDRLALLGLNVFVAGDDDQSIYSFRHASPQGIRGFLGRHIGAASRELVHCFRCTPRVLNAAHSLMAAFPGQDRVPKTQASLYLGSEPTVAGHAFRWRFVSGQREAQAIASSCRKLIDQGMSPNDIMILLSNFDALGDELQARLAAENVQFQAVQSERFVDTAVGRLTYSLLRIVRSHDDYIAYRTLLGLCRNVGAGTCLKIGDQIATNNLNFWNIFHGPLPDDVFDVRSKSAINKVAKVLPPLEGWAETDTVQARRQEIEQIITTLTAAAIPAEDAAKWQDILQFLPDQTTLKELREFLVSESEDLQHALVARIRKRLNLPEEDTVPVAPQVRLMTIHASKGLSARVVFVPGLEEDILPGPRRRPFPGLVQEGARMLYVALTRARLAFVATYSRYRLVNGQPSANRAASQYSNHLGGAFAENEGGLSDQEAAAIVADTVNL